MLCPFCSARPCLFCSPLLLSAFCLLLSAFCLLLSAFCLLLSAFCFLPSAFCFLPSAFSLFSTSPPCTETPPPAPATRCTASRGAPSPDGPQGISSSRERFGSCSLHWAHTPAGPFSARRATQHAPGSPRQSPPPSPGR